jgi:nitrogen-specific signal transduction histidine kinase
MALSTARAMRACILLSDRAKHEFKARRSSRAGCMGGTGLGLTLAKKFVELHGERSGLRASLAKARRLLLRYR